MSTNFHLLFQECVGFSGSIEFPFEFEDQLVILSKNIKLRFLMGIVLNSHFLLFLRDFFGGLIFLEFKNIEHLPFASRNNLPSLQSRCLLFPFIT